MDCTNEIKIHYFKVSKLNIKIIYAPYQYFQLFLRKNFMVFYKIYSFSKNKNPNLYQ